MIIKVTCRDAMVLVFAMDVMKSKVSGNLRKNFGIIQGKKSMKLYKSVIKKIEEKLVFNHEESDLKRIEIEMEEQEYELAKGFLDTYMDLIHKAAIKEGKDINKHPWYPALENCVYALLIAENKETVVV